MKDNSTIRPPACAFCRVIACESEPGEHRPPAFCVSEAESALLDDVEKRYTDQADIHQLSVAAAQTESSGYMRRTRIEDIMDFARRIGASKLGIAHCVGLIMEARIASEIFAANQFDVYSVCCKVGSVPKEAIGIKPEEKVSPGEYEPMCNPIAQAEVLAKAGTHLNIVIGLCVGHDSLFFWHSQAPVTVLVAKDRLLGHNPAAALYTSSSYYKRLKPTN